MIAEGAITRDPAQLVIARRLDHLSAELAGSRAQRKSNALGWLFASRQKEHPPLKGLYLHGGVGRGKTMLMDLFFEQVPIQRKRRAHFHEFMARCARAHLPAPAEAEERRDAAGRSDAAGGVGASSPRRGCSASTSSPSPTSPTR